MAPSRLVADLPGLPTGGGRVLQEHHTAAAGRHLRGGGCGEVEFAQAHRPAHGLDGRSQAGHVSHTGYGGGAGPESQHGVYLSASAKGEMTSERWTLASRMRGRDLITVESRFDQ